MMKWMSTKGVSIEQAILAELDNFSMKISLETGNQVIPKGSGNASSEQDLSKSNSSLAEARAQAEVVEGSSENQFDMIN